MAAVAETSIWSLAPSFLGIDLGDAYVSPHARNKIVLKLAHIGEERCKSFIEDFNMCCKGRSLTQIFCKGKYDASQDCMHRYMNEENLKMVARRWISQGRPKKPDWDVLLAGVQEEGDRLAEQAGKAADKA